MALSEALAIERLGRADVDAGLRLSDAAGWNQTADDWAFFVAHGDAFGIRDTHGDGALVATAAALPYGERIGWISMVLVDRAHRHQGLATRLLGACVQSLQRAGRIAVLDATPEGAAVYRQAGFVSGFAFTRWQGRGGPGPDIGADAVTEAAAETATEPISEHCTEATSEDCTEAATEVRTEAATAVTSADDAARRELLALDRASSQVDRGALLSAFLARPTTRAWLATDRSGFALLRAGRRALQLGPLVAADEQAAVGLLARALDAADGPVFVDVLDDRPHLAAMLQSRGFVRQRPFVRMALGDAAVVQPSPTVFAVAGPEFG